MTCSQNFLLAAALVLTPPFCFVSSVVVRGQGNPSAPIAFSLIRPSTSPPQRRSRHTNPRVLKYTTAVQYRANYGLVEGRRLCDRVSLCDCLLIPSKHYPKDPNILFLSSYVDSNGIEESSRPDSQINDEPKQNEKSLKYKIDVPSPPSFLALGYDVAAFLNVIAALALILNSPTVVSSASVSISAGATDAAGLLNRYQPNLFGTYFAGCLGHLLLAGGTCQILSESVRTNRLFTSDTYKRLTMGTMLFGTLGILSIPGEAGFNSFMPGGIFAVTFFAKLVTAMVSFSGWEYAAKGFGVTFSRMKNITKEIVSGCQNVWKTLPVTEKRPATFYRTFFIFTILGNIVFNVPELVYNLKQGAGLFSLTTSLTISSIARLGLLSTVVYVLKDASERKRLEGTTFVKLNTIVGLWAIGVGISQGCSTGPFSIRQAADKLFFGILFVNNAVLSQLTKMGIISKRD